MSDNIIDPQDNDAASYYETLGRRIRSRREFLRMTQDQLAQKTGYGRPTIVNIEQGRQSLAIYRLMQIACTLDTKLEHLLQLKTASGVWS